MTTTLTPGQSAALLDILSHYDTYAEIRDFRFPETLKHYGPPFEVHSGHPSTSPALQTLVTRYLLTLPGLKDLPENWWKIQCHDIIENFERSNLSESYDKGSIGSRKTLATAISALIEYPVRGTFAGFAQGTDSNPTYDTSKAGDIARAFKDFMIGCIYGSVLEETVAKVSETDKLDEHSSVVKGVHEYVLVNLASLMHYTLVLSPKGQYLLKLIDHANKLIPYMLVKQTLRIGNVASMISAMVRIGLAKMSVSSMTNWIGLTSGAAEGMNLLQHIISTVLHWDIKDLDHRAGKIEKERGKDGKEQLHVLKEYPTFSRDEQDRIRTQSQKDSVSIVRAILKEKQVEHQLNEQDHEVSLEYLSIQLSIRDRREIIGVLCHANPDHFTQSIRELVDAYYNVIKEMHNAINLSGTVGDIESFVKDMIKLARIHTDHKGHTTIPTVGDFVMLLRKHQYSCHTFIHQACKNGPELTDWYLIWAKNAAAEFKRAEGSTDKDGHVDAGKLNAELNKLFDELSEDKKNKVLPVLDAQIKYLDDMHAASRIRLTDVLHSPPSKEKSISSIFSGLNSQPNSRPSSRAHSPAPDHPPTKKDRALPTPVVSSNAGPGAFLSRWQDILDNTLISPHTQEGKVQNASSKKVVNESTKDVDGQRLAEYPAKEAKGEQVKPRTTKPDVRIVVECMADDFRRLLAEKSCTW